MTEFEMDLIKDMVSLFVVFGAVIGSLCFFYAFCMFVEVTGIFFETMKEKMEPVSYTHLDVYKRQEEGAANGMKMKTLI